MCIIYWASFGTCRIARPWRILSRDASRATDARGHQVQGKDAPLPGRQAAGRVEAIGEKRGAAAHVRSRRQVPRRGSVSQGSKGRVQRDLGLHATPARNTSYRMQLLPTLHGDERPLMARRVAVACVTAYRHSTTHLRHILTLLNDAPIHTPSTDTHRAPAAESSANPKTARSVTECVSEPGYAGVSQLPSSRATRRTQCQASPTCGQRWRTSFHRQVDIELQASVVEELGSKA